MRFSIHIPLYIYKHSCFLPTCPGYKQFNQPGIYVIIASSDFLFSEYPATGKCIMVNGKRWNRETEEQRNRGMEVRSQMTEKKVNDKLMIRLLR
jgi:hypothetical protein